MTTLDPNIVFMFPGQGSQAPGMGKELCEAFRAAADVFAEADEALGFPLSRLCFEGPADALQQTAVTQPAILTTSIAALRVVEAETSVRPIACLGHSLGEFSALVAAGALAFRDAVRLVHLRGTAMQAAVPDGEGAMAALMKLEPPVIEALCASVAAELGQVVSPANENGGGQVVIAGTQRAVQLVVARAQEKGGRAIPLRVSAPFHCALMQPAADALDEALATVPVHPLRVPVIANFDAEPNLDTGRVRALLVAQVTGRVRWEASLRRAVAMGARVGVEIGHGRVLGGLVRRTDLALEMYGVGSPAEVDMLKVAQGAAQGASPAVPPAGTP